MNKHAFSDIEHIVFECRHFEGVLSRTRQHSPATTGHRKREPCQLAERAEASDGNKLMETAVFHPVRCFVASHVIATVYTYREPEHKSPCLIHPRGLVACIPTCNQHPKFGSAQIILLLHGLEGVYVSSESG